MLNEIIVDVFAGGGGASSGIACAVGRSVDVAIDHDPAAIAMHRANHPHTKHYCESVWDVDPIEVCAGRPVGLAWFSPDCKHFSKEKGGNPVEKSIRGLAWIAVRWARLVRPRVIILENVEEFAAWGPLVDNRPPRELFRAQGFPESYIIDRDADGRSYSKSAQVARCGNAVPPALAATLVRANLPEMCSEEARESA